METNWETHGKTDFIVHCEVLFSSLRESCFGAGDATEAVRSNPSLDYMIAAFVATVSVLVCRFTGQTSRKGFHVQSRDFCGASCQPATTGCTFVLLHLLVVQARTQCLRYSPVAVAGLLFGVLTP